MNKLPKATRKRRVTANLPADLLKQARAATGKGITETIVEGLELVKRNSAVDALHRLQAMNPDFSDIDIDGSRERGRS